MTPIPSLVFLTAIVLLPICVIVVVSSERMAVSRVEQLGRRGILDPKSFLYRFPRRISHDLSFGNAHNIIGDKMLSQYIYAYRGAAFTGITSFSALFLYFLLGSLF
jgi:hypothetical protein